MEQMGLLIQTSFETPQGFSITNVYCRIKRVIYDPVRPGPYIITLSPETHLCRDRRLEGKQSIPTPGLSDSISVYGQMGDMASLYGLLKTQLEAQGFTVEDVIEPAPEPTPEASQQSSESTPSTLPTPPPPSESPESSPEPQQPPSSEYAPAPATTEA
jgi:hypothetical protein